MSRFRGKADMKFDQFQLGVYCGMLGIAFCYFLVYGPWVGTLGSAMAGLWIAYQADLQTSEGKD